MSGLSGYRPRSLGSANAVAGMHREKNRALENKFDRLQLAFNALWELIRDATRLTAADLEAKMREIDLRDGKADGKITDLPVRCPACKRVSSTKHWKCLYCGQEFEREYPV